jgi:hypothetical protein
MSTPFYDLASLVVVPSGYKSGKIYAQKPLTTDGQLTFTRSNDTATRVASNGLIERVRTNLILQSNSFSDAAWVKLGVGTGTAPVLTANYTTDPFGGNNAWRLQCDLNGGTASGDRSWIYQTFAGSPSNGTLSIYVKLNSAGSVNLVFSDGAGDTQTVTSTTWVRLNIPSAAIGEFRLGLIGYNGTDTCDLSIAFSQVEAGDIATDYILTTSGAVSVGPVANVPRLDYLNSSCPRLILEPQRQNLANWSEQAGQYVLAGSTIGSNVLTSPDGYTNADSLIEDGTTGAHAFYNFGLTTFTAAAYTASVFAKKGGRDWFALQLYHGSSHIAYFNLNTGVLGNVAAGATATITNYGNGWYRCTITATTTVNAGGIAIYGADADNSISYAGTNGLAAGYFYGWQLELGTYASSYIPTLGSASTRGSDAASKTGISSLIGQTEGTLFLEIDVKNVPVDNSYVLLRNAAVNDYLGLRIQAGNLRFETVDNGVLQTAINYVANTPQTVKVAMAYKLNDFVMYVNGTQVGTDTSATVPTCDILDLSFNAPSANAYGIAQTLIFKTRLSNDSLAALTA